MTGKDMGLRHQAVLAAATGQRISNLKNELIGPEGEATKQRKKA